MERKGGGGAVVWRLPLGPPPSHPRAASLSVTLEAWRGEYSGARVRVRPRRRPNPRFLITPLPSLAGCGLNGESGCASPLAGVAWWWFPVSVSGLDGPCDKGKTMAAEAGNAVAAPDMGQVMAVETSNMGYDLLDTQFLPESNYSDVICCLDERCGFDQNELDVAAAPSLLLCHHKKLHIESNSTSCSQQSLSSTLIEDQQQSTSQHTSDTVHSAASASGFCPLNIISSTDGPLDRDNASCTKHSSSSIRELSTAERTVTPGCTGSSIGDVNITSMQFSDQNEPYAGGDKPCSNFSVICSSRKSEESDLSINIPQDKMFDALNDKSLNIDEKDTEPVSNLVPEMNEYPIGRATPTSPKTNRQWNRFISISRTFGSDSKSLPEDLKLTGFACHSKKPQTQISYSVSHRREDLGIKHNGDYCKMQSHSSAKTNDTKRLPQNSRSGHSSSESLTCVANVLVTVGDRGWREYNTHITVDSDDQSEQRICVELAKGIKYAHKVCEALQRGVTNRYTRAMIWKGGAEWCLEFPDKGQWLIFKQMHDECYSHNIRTASVKKIPIPGVHLVEGHDDNDAVSFVRSQDHLCHIGTDVELALNESCVIYDMDSDDEEWITSQKKPLVGENTAALELTEDLFEKIMDKLERFAYSHNSSMLTIDQMKELDTGNVPLDIIKIIHTYWQDKRQKKGMPLIRHFQSAMWKTYEQQLHEWESTVCRMQESSNGYQEKKLPPKPAMFAFCLRPQISYKGPMQRSHKKLMSSGCHSISRHQDGYNKQYQVRNACNERAVDGRTSESYNEERKLRDAMNAAQQASAMAKLKRDRARCLMRMADLARRKASVAMVELARKLRVSPTIQVSNRDTSWDSYQVRNACNERAVDGRTSESYDEERKLRDAVNAAQQAAAMVKLKRDRARCLMRMADLARRKASVAMVELARKLSVSPTIQGHFPGFGTRDLRDQERCRFF